MLPQAKQCTEDVFLGNSLPTLPWKTCCPSKWNLSPWLSLPLAVCPIAWYQRKESRCCKCHRKQQEIHYLKFQADPGKQIRLSADEEGKKTQQLLLTWSKGRLFADHSAGSSLVQKNKVHKLSTAERLLLTQLSIHSTSCLWLWVVSNASKDKNQ